jgi:hypothetical protein
MGDLLIPVNVGVGNEAAQFSFLGIHKSDFRYSVGMKHPSKEHTEFCGFLFFISRMKNKNIGIHLWRQGNPVDKYTLDWEKSLLDSLHQMRKDVEENTEADFTMAYNVARRFATHLHLCERLRSMRKLIMLRIIQNYQYASGSVCVSAESQRGWEDAELGLPLHTVLGWVEVEFVVI